METIVISLGGSLIVPDELDIEYLKKFKEFVEGLINNGKRVVIVAGGGAIARKYQTQAKAISSPSKTDLDWVGIAATHLNAQLLKSMFGESAYEEVIKDYSHPITTDKKIIIGAGWKPGHSTDFDTVAMAKHFNAETMLNLSNIAYVYDKDPKLHDDAEKIEKISWKEFRKIVGDEWNPGLNLPFDPIAAKEAEKIGLKVIIMDGSDIENILNFLNNNEFSGTIIE